MSILLDLLFGRCTHANYSFPQTVRKQTTVSCLECGQRYLYDWAEMKIAKPVKRKTIAPVLEMDR